MNFRKIKVAKGRSVFEEGEKGNDFYLIEDGKVEVYKKIQNEEIVLARLGKGEILGEMAVLGDKVRTAHVRASEDTTLFILNEEAINLEKSKASQWFIKILDLLIRRLKETNRNIRGHFKHGIVYSTFYLTILLTEKFGKETETMVNDKKINVSSLGMDFIISKINKIFGISNDEIKDSLLSLHEVKLIQVNTKDKMVYIDDMERAVRYLKFIESEGYENIEPDLSEAERREKLEFIEIYKEIIRNSKSTFIYS